MSGYLCPVRGKVQPSKDRHLRGTALKVVLLIVFRVERIASEDHVSSSGDQACTFSPKKY